MDIYVYEGHTNPTDIILRYQGETGLVTYTKEYILDVLLQEIGITKQWNIDTLLLSNITKNYGIDSTLLKAISLAYSIDVDFLKTIDKQFGIDTYLLAFSRSFGIDTYIYETPDYNNDICLYEGHVNPKDIILRDQCYLTYNNPYEIDSLFLKTIESIFVSDTLLQKEITGIFGIDAYLQSAGITTYTSSFGIDTQIRPIGWESIPVVTIRDRDGDDLFNASYSHLVAIEINNIESRAYTFRCLNKSDCDSFESLRSYSNPYYSSQSFLRNANYVVDNSSSQVNSIWIKLPSNASVYDGKGVITDIEVDYLAGHNINDRFYTLKLYWLGSSFGSELYNGTYIKDIN